MARRRRRKGGSGRPQQQHKRHSNRNDPGRGSTLSTGARVGQTIGRALGGFAQKALGRIFGVGEYEETLANEVGVPVEELASGETPEVNSLVEPVSSDVAVPMMHSDKEGSVRIVRREFVGIIEIEDDPRATNYKVTPSDANMFPWLNGIAHAFQQWSVLGFAAEYVPTSGFAVGNDSAALGQVAMAFRYNVAEDPDSFPHESLTGMLNMNGSTSCSPAACGVCYMECDPTLTNQFTRFIANEPLTGAYSQQNFEAAELMVLTVGAQNLSAQACGQLWITYEIVLHQPRPINPTPALDAWYMDPVFAPFLPVYRKLVYYSTFSGPIDPALYPLVRGEIDRLRDALANPAAKAARRVAETRLGIKVEQQADHRPAEIEKFLGNLKQTPLFKAVHAEEFVDVVDTV